MKCCRDTTRSDSLAFARYSRAGALAPLRPLIDTAVGQGRTDEGRIEQRTCPEEHCLDSRRPKDHEGEEWFVRFMTREPS